MVSFTVCPKSPKTSPFLEVLAYLGLGEVIQWAKVSILIFRHGSVSNTYPGLSVRRRHTFGFPFCRRLCDLTKRRDDIAVADMAADTAANMEVHMVADTEVDKVADMVADMVVDMPAYLIFFLFLVLG